MLFLPHPALPGLMWGWLQVLPLSEGRKISSSQEDPPGSPAEGQTPPHPPRLPCFVQRAQKLSWERSWAPCPAPGLQNRSQPVLASSSPNTDCPFVPVGTMQWKRRTVAIPLPPLEAKECQPCRSPTGENNC